MLRSVASLFLTMCLAIAVAGCGQAGGPPPAPSMPTMPAVRSITLADNGRTLTLAVGDRFLLMLGTDFDWTVGPLEPRVIRPVADDALGAGVQGSYEAVAPGTVTLSATGDPPCRKVTPPCAAPSLLFAVALVVR